MDRIAELAAELMDEAMRRLEPTLGESPFGDPVSAPARQQQILAAHAMVKAAVAAAAERHTQAVRARVRPATPG